MPMNLFKMPTKWLACFSLLLLTFSGWWANCSCLQTLEWCHWPNFHSKELWKVKPVDELFVAWTSFVFSKILVGVQFHMELVLMIVTCWKSESFYLIVNIWRSVHMEIQFQSRHHGDADSFDGRGGVGNIFSMCFHFYLKVLFHERNRFHR